MLFAFADRLRKLRRGKDYTLDELADRLAQKNVSIGQAALGKYESGRTYPNLETAAALADVFDVSLDFLAMGEKSKTLTFQDLSEEQIELVTQIVALLRMRNRSGHTSGSLPVPSEQEVVFKLISQFIK